MHKAYLNTGHRNEIILSAGAMGSSQLLMLSGVGPADHLRSFNITLVLNQSAIGQGMGDNPMNAIFVPSPAVQLRSRNDDPPPPAVDKDDDSVGDPQCLDDEPTTTAPAASLCPCHCTCCGCSAAATGLLHPPLAATAHGRPALARLASPRCRAGERLLLGGRAVQRDSAGAGVTQLADGGDGEGRGRWMADLDRGEARVPVR
ncbi:Protein HOTHEAD [Hordeum vulgare]|nr:Protein HOTHEAD [Hordeum vulgare]